MWTRLFWNLHKNSKRETQGILLHLRKSFISQKKWMFRHSYFRDFQPNKNHNELDISKPIRRHQCINIIWFSTYPRNLNSPMAIQICTFLYKNSLRLGRMPFSTYFIAYLQEHARHLVEIDAEQVEGARGRVVGSARDLLCDKHKMSISQKI